MVTHRKKHLNSKHQTGSSSFPHPNEREDMTYPEAKDIVAKIHYSNKWDEIDWYHLNEINERTVPPYMKEILLIEAAELYARSKWDEACEAQKLIDSNLLNDWEFGGRSQVHHFKDSSKPEFKP